MYIINDYILIDTDGIKQPGYNNKKEIIWLYLRYWLENLRYNFLTEYLSTENREYA